MINCLIAHYFESHLDTRLDFCNGVNVIFGISDKGKSGLVRAIKLNAQNRPIGDVYRTDSLDPKKKEDKIKISEVIIDYKNSGVVSRRRDAVSGGVNHYQIDEGQPLVALRTDVPDEVQEVTRMKEVNIQGQHPTEQYFLLADKPGQVAKRFNQVAGLTIMDDAIKSINSQVRTCNSKIAISKDLIDEKEKELKETKWILKAKKFAKELDNLQTKKNETALKYSNLHDTIKTINEISEKLRQLDRVEKAKLDLQDLENQKIEIADKECMSSHLNELILSIISVDLQLNSMTDIDKALTALKTLEKLDADARGKSQKMLEINLIVNEYTSCTNKLDYAEKDYLVHLKKYETLREKSICPTCGRTGS